MAIIVVIFIIVYTLLQKYVRGQIITLEKKEEK
jgi:hypothetical protein